MIKDARLLYVDLKTKNIEVKTLDAIRIMAGG